MSQKEKLIEKLKSLPKDFRQYRTIRLRHLPDKTRPDFVIFSCNTQSIPAKKCLYQNPFSLGICSCRIMRYCLYI